MGLDERSFLLIVDFTSGNSKGVSIRRARDEKPSTYFSALWIYLESLMNLLYVILFDIHHECLMTVDELTTVQSNKTKGK